MKRDLIDRAKTVLAVKRRQKSVYLRRAVSDAYYALFHALCASNADSLVGVKRRGDEAWLKVYRGLDHSRAKELFKRASFRDRSQHFRFVGAAFVELQEQRHIADYDPTPHFRSRDDVGPIIALAEAAIISLEIMPSSEAVLLATLLLVKER